MSLASRYREAQKALRELAKAAKAEASQHDFMLNGLIAENEALKAENQALVAELRALKAILAYESGADLKTPVVAGDAPKVADPRPPRAMVVFPSHGPTPRLVICEPGHDPEAMAGLASHTVRHAIDWDGDGVFSRYPGREHNGKTSPLTLAEAEAWVMRRE